MTEIKEKSNIITRLGISTMEILTDTLRSCLVNRYTSLIINIH